MNTVDFKPEYLDHVEVASWIAAGFVNRVKGVEVSTDKDTSVAALEPTHLSLCDSLGFNKDSLYRATQVHGSVVTEITSVDQPKMIEGADGLMTRMDGVMLGIYVADCGAIYVVDTKQKGIALLHSGKKGTEANILGVAIERMKREWGSRPEKLQVLLAPCIRPPHYEIDFAETIREQVLAAGVPAPQYLDCGICTGEQVSEYYSYRVEKGNTGRNLALLGIKG